MSGLLFVGLPSRGYLNVLVPPPRLRKRFGVQLDRIPNSDATRSFTDDTTSETRWFLGLSVC